MLQLKNAVLWLSLSGCMLSVGCSDQTVDLNGHEQPPGGDETPIEVAIPDGTVASYDKKGAIGVFPSDLYSKQDDTRETGRTVVFSADTGAGNRRWSPVKRQIADSLDGLDGFGTSAGAWMLFSAPLDEEQSGIDDATFFGYFEGDETIVLPGLNTLDEQQIATRPHMPIPPIREGFFFVTTDVVDINGDNVVQDPYLTAIFDGKNPKGYPVELQERIRKAADRFIAKGLVPSTDKIAGMSVFTTQSIYSTDLELAQYIRDLDNTSGFKPNPSMNHDCEDVPGHDYRYCTFEFEAPHIATDDRTILDDAADHITENYSLTGHVFLPRADLTDLPIPKSDDGYAVMIFGHGLTGAGDEAGQIARFCAEYGLAVISIDAPLHGNHPLQPAEDVVEKLDDLGLITELFGIELEGKHIGINTKRLRDGWRLSNFDKLALIEAMKEQLDIDGDDTPDLDLSRMIYLGGSLGAIQGAEFMALTDTPKAGMFAVGAGRLSDIVRYGAIFAVVQLALFPNEEDAAILQALVMLQTAVEKGDGVNWGGHIQYDRLQSGDGYDNAFIPEIAAQISVPDGVVTEQAGMALARSMKLDGVGTLVFEDPIVKSLGEHVSQNRDGADGAKHTAGILQTDCIQKSAGAEWRASEHANSADSVQGMEYWSAAFLSLLDPTGDGIMKLIDPYTVEGAEQRPESCN